jgi:peroxiredoxin
MKRIAVSFVFIMLSFSLLLAGGYKVGDKASDFKLENIDGKFISMADYPEAKGFVIVFTCNGCPYAIAYQDRIIEMDKKYKLLGYPVIAINPNNTEMKPDDDLDAMKKRAKAKGYTFPYLKDANYEVFEEYGATRTPHVFVLTKDGNDMVVSYIGGIDDNYQDVSSVKQPYLSNALKALLADNEPDPSFTKAIGCSIKKK